MKDDGSNFCSGREEVGGGNEAQYDGSRSSED